MFSVSLRTLILNVLAMRTPLVIAASRPYDASNASEVIRITNHVWRNVTVVMMMMMRRRRNEAELHITSTRKYNIIDDKEDGEEIAKQLVKAIKFCLSEVPNK
ncbi:hypothetical protein SUGI_0626450 [Cryptomeria japonica]|nr:hypothetical protein SUGI_0626450 [Cryptomeria japonica]